MRFVDNGNGTDPYLNLALEEYLLQQAGMEEPLLLLYVNEPAVIVGRNQNVFAETDPRFIRNNQIQLLRRLSGGGTVYHDLGNLNYSFITPGQADLHRFDRVTEPVIRVLRQLGVRAERRGRSDIVVGDMKISGNAQYASKGRMFTHGTLLFDTDLDALNQAIRPAHREITSRAVQSVRSTVRNIRDLLPRGWTIADLQRAILAGIFGPGDVPLLQLGPGDWEQVERIAGDRYRSWAWNIGRSPRFSLVRTAQVAGRLLEVRIEVGKGLVRQVESEGAFSQPQVALSINQALHGVRYDPDDLLAALHSLPDEHFSPLPGKEAFVALLYG